MEDDFMDIGEGAFHSDEEGRRDEEDFPQDIWEREFEQMDKEEVQNDVE